MILIWNQRKIPYLQDLKCHYNWVLQIFYIVFDGFWLQRNLGAKSQPTQSIHYSPSRSIQSHHRGFSLVHLKKAQYPRNATISQLRSGQWDVSGTCWVGPLEKFLKEGWLSYDVSSFMVPPTSPSSCLKCGLDGWCSSSHFVSWDRPWEKKPHSEGGRRKTKRTYIPDDQVDVMPTQNCLIWDFFFYLIGSPLLEFFIIYSLIHPTQ